MAMDIRMLGPLEVRGRAGVARLGGPRQRTVLAALLLHANKMVSAPHLVQVVWDRPPDTSLSKLRTYVSELRRSLRDSGESAPRLVTRPGGYQLTLEPGELDLDSFEQFARRGQRALHEGDWTNADRCLASALRLWRGDPFDGLTLTPALHAELTRLEERRGSVLEHRIEARINLGHTEDLVGELRAFVGRYPLREKAWSWLMLVLYRCGRQAEALQAYLDARQVLADNLGIEPGPELRRMQRRILREEPGLVATPRAEPAVGLAVRCNYLPCDVANFTGRKGEQRLLAKAVERDVPAVCLIDGMAGAGKTSLAVRVAHQLVDRYPDAQFFVELGGHQPARTPTDPREALGTLLGEIGMVGHAMPDDLAGRAALWRSRIAGHRVLLVLDDAVSAEQVQPLLPGTSDCLVLVTSRSRLPELDAVRVLSLDPLPRCDAIALFTGIVGADRVAAEPDATERVVRLCGYLPMAVRIAGSRLRARPAWRIEHLAARLCRPGSRPVELAAGTHTVAAAFDRSYRRLEPAHRRAFRLLGLHPGTDCTLPAAAALIGRRPADAEVALETLLDRHLVEQVTAGRYRMHDLVRCYARRLADLEEPVVERRAALSRLTALRGEDRGLAG